MNNDHLCPLFYFILFFQLLFLLFNYYFNYFIYFILFYFIWSLARAALLNEIRRFCVLSFPGSISLALGLAYQLRAELRNKGIASYCLCFRFLSRLSMLTIQNVKAYQKPCATLISAQGNHMPKSGPRYPFDRSNFICLSHTLTILGFHNNWMENSSRMVLKRCINVISRDACVTYIVNKSGGKAPPK